MFGSGSVGTLTNTIKKTVQVYGTGSVPNIVLPDGTEIALPATGTFYDETGNTVTSREAGKIYFYTVDVPTSAYKEIEISSATFPGTYYITGDTYARSQTTGKDEFFQYIIPKAKVNSENTITLEAEGDPSTFNMTVRVLRPNDGKMMKLVQYSLGADATGTITGTGIGEGKVITIAKGGTATLSVAIANSTGTVTVTPTSGDVSAALSNNNTTLTITVDADAAVGAYSVQLKNGDAGTTVLDTITVNVIAST